MTNTLSEMLRPQSILRKTARNQRLPSDEDIRENKESLLHDIEKKLRFKEDIIRQGAQVLESFL